MPINKVVIFLTLILDISLLRCVSTQCQVNIQEDLPAKDPVYLKHNGIDYSLWAPDGPYFNWVAGESNIVACSGTGNIVSISNETATEITCSSQSNFLVKGNTYNSKIIECSKTITGDIETTTATCSNSIGVLQNIGFKTVQTGLVPYIQVCYNMNTGSVMYTRHTIPGKSIKYSVQESARPSFKSTGTAPQVNPATSYTQAAELKRLTTLLGSATQASKFISTNSYLARGHLSPDGDGVLRSWQFATYFYSNVAPQWQVTNAGNWLRVENAARTKADLLQLDLLIFTGCKDILTLPHVNGTEIPITLEEPGNIIVPKYYWKIIKNVANNSGIVLITLNNPFAIFITPICEDVCQMSGWNNTNYGDYSRGYTYCCTVSSFISINPDLPFEAAADNILFF